MIDVRQPRWLRATTGRCVSVFAALAVVSLLSVGLVSFRDAQAQKRRARKPTSRPSSPATTINYSQFSHATKKHQSECSSCHRVPTGNWKKVRGYPDVADYPGHDACVSCHRPQFFKGAKPAICSVCHSKVSPRDDARFAFRNPASPRQFLIEFPHDKHQDVIAKLFRPDSFATQTVSLAVAQTVSLRAWAHARSASTEQSQISSLRYNNCEICHGARTTVPVAPAKGWTDAYVPDAETFRAAPTTHAACFNCHWKSQPPTSDNCAGCHTLTGQPYFAVDAPTRLSLKFRHGREQHVQECTTCHINITRATTLTGLQPDVPITSCTECHQREGLREDVGRELEAIDKNRDFVCSYCHTSDVGRRDPPPGHYLIAGRELLKRKDIK